MRLVYTACFVISYSSSVSYRSMCYSLKFIPDALIYGFQLDGQVNNNFIHVFY
jgi:hypothetical protein